MPRVSDEYMAHRREEILAAARACFAREGFHATSMRDIYRECGLSPGGVYNHFASKEQIVRALGEERLRDARARREALELIEDPIEALRLLAAGTREELVREEDLLLDLQLAGEALRNESIAEVSRQAFEATLQTVVGLIGRAQRTGHLDPHADADALARVLIGAFQGVAVQTAIGAPPERERHIGALRTLLAPVLSAEARERLSESPTIRGGRV
ncbi:MAG TPA: helix-turn-helix domain-containing protein [Solirubrobacteraceae bacterium]|jgi:TetR/AcrR family transcriptional repressor of uid operon|nr:helix-turn-helix domain-containing protein [Solirubrobacteraceae bacterium]